MTIPRELAEFATGYGAGSFAVGRNRIINGDMRIAQRGTSALTSSSGAQFPVDRFFFIRDTATTAVMTAEQSTTAPAGFVNSVKVTTTTAQASLAGTDYHRFAQNIEGLNVADLGWGTANAQPVTLSFWVRSSLTGTFGGSLGNSAWNRTYPFTYSISAADTWEKKSITIAGDTSGTWLTTNGIGLRVDFGLGVGSTYSGSAGSWAGALYISATGATNVSGTLNATWYITGVQLEAGSVATPFERRSYGQELALCQRYYYSMPGMTNYPAFHYNFSAYTNVILPVTMRTTPTVTANGIGSTYYEAGTLHTFTVVNFAGQNTQSVSLQVSVSGGTSGFAGTFYPVFQASAEL